MGSTSQGTASQVCPVRACALRFHVVAYDRRDAGESTHFPAAGPASPITGVLRRRSAAYTAEDMTDDAVAVMDALGWESAHLSGHSMGGLPAQRTALRYPGGHRHPPRTGTGRPGLT